MAVVRPIGVMLLAPSRLVPPAPSGLIAPVHAPPWLYAAPEAVTAVVLGYRLLADQKWCRTLVALVEDSPGETIAIVGEDPGGTAMGLWVSDGASPFPGEAWSGR